MDGSARNPFLYPKSLLSQGISLLKGDVQLLLVFALKPLLVLASFGAELQIYFENGYKREPLNS